MSVNITAVAKALPQHWRDTSDILPFLDVWLAGQDNRFQRKVKKIFENAAVDRRYSIMSPTEVFAKTSFEEKNAIYSRESIKLAENSIQTCLGENSVDYYGY